MQVTPFLLDRWLNAHQFSSPPIEFDLAASTGPRWTWRDLATLLAPEALEHVLDGPVSYGPATGSWALRVAIAEMAGVSPDKVIIVTGASEALWILFLAAAEPGGNVVLPHPGYPTLDEAPRCLGLEVRRYHLRASAGHAIDLDEIAALIDDHTTLIVVNTPHNPTGAVVSDAQMQLLNDLAVERRTRLVVDEVYHPIYHGPPSSSAARLADATTVGDLSKAMCLSGLRIGWIIDHDPVRLAQYEDARSYLTISSAPIIEVFAEAAVRARDTILARARAVTDENLTILDAFFDDHTAQLEWVRPTGGMTAFPSLRSNADARPLCINAAAAGVLVAPGDCFGMPAHLRLGFGATDEGFPEAITRLARLVEQSR